MTIAVLERIGEHWTVSDDGLSRNGSYLNGERVTGRKRLREGDELRFGSTLVIYRCSGSGASGAFRALAVSQVSGESR